MSEAFLKVVNMGISAGWLVLAVLALRLILNKAPKWVNVLLWGIVAVRLICPFSIESALSLIPSTETISPEIMMDWTPEISTGIAPLDQAVNPVISTSFAPHPGASANPLQILIPVAANLWLLGVLILLAYTAISYLSLRCRLITAVILRDNIFQCETVSSPFVLGILKPKIYLPYAMEEQNLSHVIAHEQAHIRRKDHWWKPLGFLLLTVYWFNPLMWVAYILLCRDIELACDEKVISELGNEQRADYTQALVACAVNRRMIAACPLAFGEVGVKDRVKSIMNYRKPTFWIIVTALAVCAVVAICFLTNPKEELQSDIFEQFFDFNDGQVEIMQGNSNNSYSDYFVTVNFVSSSGPTEFYVEVWFKKYAQDSWIRTEPVLLNLSDSYSCNVPANYTFAVMAAPRNGSNGYASFKVMIGEAKDEIAEPPSENIAEQLPEHDGIAFGSYYLEGVDTGITEIKIRNLHNGQDTNITDLSVIEFIGEFISKVAGTNPSSSKGYYGGSYQVQMLNGSEVVLSIGFGDDESFNYGEYSDGYPTRYALRGVTREDVIRFFGQYDSSDFDWGLGEAGSTYEIYNVAPLENLPGNYNLEEATIDKCVIIVDGDIRDNVDSWTEFINDVEAGKNAAVRVVHYYHGSDTEPYSMYIFDLTYDGESYQLRWFEEGKEYVQSYQYLRHFSGEAETAGASYDAYDSYILTDNTTATRWEMFLSYASSAYGAGIPHYEIYTDLIFYPDYPQIPAVLTKADLYTSSELPDLEIILMASYSEEKMLARLQEFLSSAQALDYTPKTYGICCNLILTGEDGTTVDVGLDAESDLLVIDGVFYDYGPGYDENGSLDATMDLLRLLGFEEWPRKE